MSVELEPMAFDHPILEFPVDDDLEDLRCLVRCPELFCCREQTHVVLTTEVSHHRVDVPEGRDRTTRTMRGWNEDVQPTGRGERPTLGPPPLVGLADRVIGDTEIPAQGRQASGVSTLSKVAIRDGRKIDSYRVSVVYLTTFAR